jgi:hypothetical protein
MRRAWILVALAALLGSARGDEKTKTAYVEIDYSTLEKKIAKEPAYVAQPLYALFVLDDAGKFRAWAVLDKSKKDLAYYDVLYFDKNGDGDLTAPGKRFTSKYDESQKAYGMALEIVVGDVPVPGTDVVHKNFRVSTVMKAGWKGFWTGLDWAGKGEVSGGYGACGYDLTVWSESAAKAPVLRFSPNGPLSFGIWGDGKLGLGGATRVSLIVGNKGSGPDTLSVVDDNFLTPGKDRIFATVIAKDANGKEVRAKTEIKGHC